MLATAHQVGENSTIDICIFLDYIPRKELNMSCKSLIFWRWLENNGAPNGILWTKNETSTSCGIYDCIHLYMFTNNLTGPSFRICSQHEKVIQFSNQPPPNPPPTQAHTQTTRKNQGAKLTHLTSHTINLQTKTLGLRVFTLAVCKLTSKGWQFFHPWKLSTKNSRQDFLVTSLDQKEVPLINGNNPSWWFQPLWKIGSSNWESSPRFGVKIKNIWNHHLESD